MPTLTLHCSPGSCARATMIALEEAGAAYDTHVVNLVKGDQRTAAYLALNPKGKVPVLLVDGVALTESVAILGWIADRYPEARLLPADPLQRAAALSLVSWMASAVLTAFGRHVRPERISGDPDAAASIRAAALVDMQTNLAIAERHLDGRAWWVDSFSVADAYLYYIICNAAGRFGLDFAPYPALAAHRAHMEDRPSTRRMLAWEEVARAAMI